MRGLITAWVARLGDREPLADVARLEPPLLVPPAPELYELVREPLECVYRDWRTALAEKLERGQQERTVRADIDPASAAGLLLTALCSRRPQDPKALRTACAVLAVRHVLVSCRNPSENHLGPSMSRAKIQSVDAPTASLEVRTRLVKALKLDLVGPWAGHPLADERLQGWTRPSTWYLTGFLIPSGTAAEHSADPDEDDDLSDGRAGAGVSVIMRYTLRLLTLDQLGRAAGLVCALELERESDPARYGQVAFRDRPVGGQGGDPQRPRSQGRKKRSDSARSKVCQFKSNPTGKPSPIPLENCPWCGERFRPESFDLRPDGCGHVIVGPRVR